MSNRSVEKPDASMKDRLDSSSYSAGHTTIAASSVFSGDSLTPIDDLPLPASVERPGPGRKKPKPINQPVNQPDYSKTIALARQGKYSNLWDALLADGWTAKEATWSEKWWSCELVYIPPWNSTGLEMHFEYAMISLNCQPACMCI
jgi:hypothetical protein